LATVSKFARKILQDHTAETSADIRSMVERMESAAVRVESLLQYLLEYCLGVEDVAHDPVSLEELMQHVVMEQRAAIDRGSANVTIERPLPCVRGARLALGHVLAAVLNNVLKRTSANHVALVRVSARQNDAEVVLTVADEGAPFAAPPEESFRVLEMQRATNFFSEHGVGFAIIRQTVERMHGRVWIESGLGKPTRFNIGLPSV
jgi:light-regulated signal transduction histidine kinase (bacteriophytochrome)